MEDSTERNYYMVRGKWAQQEEGNIFLKNNVVAIGWSRVNFTDYDSADKLREAVK